MLLLKPGVRVAGLRPEILLGVVAAERVFEEAGVDLVVTACVDGKHSAGSLHYAGQAVDLRTRDLAAEARPKLGVRIRECLGEDYDVVLEPDHIHLEFQPKRPLTNA
ncbi:MAG TPA: hypothetical protein VN428_08965 [Bryobacteraceae bacterium]|nr:hypothetical protein [Bryobacteraceae bacterium]